MNNFNLAIAAAVDTAELEVVYKDKPTGWKITFAGPAHERTMAANDKLAKEALHHAKRIESARVNGKKFIPDDRTPEQARLENVKYLAARTLSWTPVNFSTEKDAPPYECTPENVEKLYLNAAFGWLLRQINEFLDDDRSFMTGSATN